MEFDYFEKLKIAFKNNIYESSSEEERKKEIIILSLKALSDKPQRVIGFLRFQGIRQKLVQFLTQSLEIKTGDMLEEFFTSMFGFFYNNLNKIINGYLCDQLFEKTSNDEKKIYLIEQKIRDDHDSSKKEGQVRNFENKIFAIHSTYPSAYIEAYEWFIDDTFKKNSDYYNNEYIKFRAGKEDWLNGDVVYGGKLIEKLCGTGSWQKFVDAYNAVKKQYVSDLGSIINSYDFDHDSCDIVFNYYKNKREKGLQVFFEDNYTEVREALFSNNIMSKKLFDYFSKKNSKTANYFVDNYIAKHKGEEK